MRFSKSGSPVSSFLMLRMVVGVNPIPVKFECTFYHRSLGGVTRGTLYSQRQYTFLLKITIIALPYVNTFDF